MGERWLTDEVIDTGFGTINKKHDDTICFVCKPTRIMYSPAGLSEKLRRIYDNSFTVSRVIVALNVGCDDRGTYMSDEKRRGVHYALLVIDVKNGTSYYGDSLGWSLPNNLADTVGSNFKNGGGPRDKHYHYPIDMNRFSCDASNTGSEPCRLFYPLQSCSHVCGVIVVCMAAILCDHLGLWLRCGNQMGEIPLLSNPSTNSMQLRLIVLSWIVNDNVTSTHVLLPHRQISSNNQVSVYADSDHDFTPTKFDKSSKLTANDSESGMNE